MRRRCKSWAPCPPTAARRTTASSSTAARPWWWPTAAAILQTAAAVASVTYVDLASERLLERIELLDSPRFNTGHVALTPSGDHRRGVRAARWSASAQPAARRRHPAPPRWRLSRTVTRAGAASSSACSARPCRCSSTKPTAWCSPPTRWATACRCGSWTTAPLWKRWSCGGPRGITMSLDRSWYLISHIAGKQRAAHRVCHRHSPGPSASTSTRATPAARTSSRTRCRPQRPGSRQIARVPARPPAPCTSGPPGPNSDHDQRTQSSGKRAAEPPADSQPAVRIGRCPKRTRPTKTPVGAQDRSAARRGAQD